MRSGSRRRDRTLASWSLTSRSMALPCTLMISKALGAPDQHCVQDCEGALSTTWTDFFLSTSPHVGLIPDLLTVRTNDIQSLSRFIRRPHGFELREVIAVSPVKRTRICFVGTVFSGLREVRLADRLPHAVCHSFCR